MVKIIIQNEHFKRKFKSINFLLVFCLLFLISLNSAGAVDSNEELSFLIFGHIYPDYDVLNLSIRLILEENPDFVVFLGDSVSNMHSKTWDSLKPIIDRIDVPTYFAPGNHDLTDYPEDKENFKENISGSLFQEFNIKNHTFIILNSVMGTDEYDISYEQIAFIESIYNRDENNKFIFMHHCLFYKDNNQLCNYRGNLISKDSNWNSKIVPIIQNDTLCVFIGDSGFREPYFSYEENNISYLGVGFSFDKLKFPRHMLKVSLVNKSFSVTPIPLVQDLTKIKYDAITDKSLYSKLKSFILNNLKLILLSLLSIIILLFIIILYLLSKLKISRILYKTLNLNSFS